MTKTIKHLGLVLLLSIFPMSLLFASGPSIRFEHLSLEAGLPLLRSFSPKEYGAGTQNWAIVQDLRGVIYVGNKSGILEFDGQRWRLIRVANNTVVRSLALDAQGRVYVGAIGEIGTLEADASGQVRYISLLDRVPPEARNFADVWNTFVTPQGVVFSSRQRLMRLQGDQFESWTPAATFHIAFQVGDRLFIREPGRGLLELSNGKLNLLPGGERFADEKIYAMLLGESTTQTAPPSILIGTRTQGFVIFDPNGFKAWPSDIDAELKRDLLYTAIRLPDGRLALGTLQGGLYLIDAQGRSLAHLSKANGLPNDSIYALSLDREGGLWIATANGQARAEVASPLSHFDERIGLAGTVNAVHRHQGQLYVATSQGLFRLRPGPTARFERIPGIDSESWAFQTMGEQLLVANYQGVYEVASDSATLIKTFDSAYSLHASQAQPGRVFVGGRAGLAALRWVEGRWQDEGPVSGIDDEVSTLLEDRDGGLWLGTLTSGVLRVYLPTATGDYPLVPTLNERFGVAEGLPSLNNSWVYSIGDEAGFATESGIYLFDKTQHRFEPDSRFTGLFTPPRKVSSLVEDSEHGIWMFAKNPVTGLEEVGLAAPLWSDSSYQWNARAFQALRGSDGFAMQRIHRDVDGRLWFGGADGLFRYDPRIAKNYAQPFPAIVHRVSRREDRLLFSSDGEPAAHRLPYTDNALRFDYAAPSFDGLDALRFQVRLDGSDSDWSDWSAETYKDYNNLFEGNYRFRVRAKNLYNTISSQAVYTFTVLPPWYRTLWAYLLYVLILGSSSWGALRWRMRHLQAQKRTLEATVAERTRQLAGLGEIGRKITSTLDLDAALDTLYAKINQMLDASVFGIGLYHAERGEIEFRLAIQMGQRYQPYVRRMDEKNQFAVWCIEHGEPILIGNYPKEYSRYLATSDDSTRPLVDGTISQAPLSALYVPLLLKGEVIGVLSVQSFKTQAYDSTTLDLLQTLAAYAATAIDNANAYREVEEKNKEILANQQQIIQSSKMASLGVMTAGVAHEINNPINFAYVAVYMMKDEIGEIKAFLKQLAGGDNADPKVIDAFNEKFTKLIELVQTATEGTNRIKTIVQDLRTFARLDDAKKATVNVTDLLTSTVHLVQTQYERIEIETQFHSALEISCFPSKLNQVFMNIIVNACQAIVTKQASEKDFEGKVIITTSEQNSQLMVCFKDNGCGMNEATQEHIFEPFYTTKEVGSGTGLGMSISFGIIEEHAGSIDIISTLGEGSEIIIIFRY